MQVSKWGNSLAVRLPKRVVEELGLQAGEEIDLMPVDRRRFEVQKRDRRAEFLDKMKRFSFPLPEGYRFDRDEANER
ncbi:MAG: AbrB/MazE/SpoVT family DNA-binding domain-containing protein [Methylobacteriaceae bacterium]|nr:AbrB/MazE/SpoVT family DNA-binding domain-containing protein [Methylobacteriaceae bacterium]